MYRQIYIGIFILCGLITPFHVLSATVLFDDAHRQAFKINKQGKLDLSQFAQIITDAGNQVQAVSHPFTHGILSNIDAVIVSGPFKSFQPLEIAAIKHFVESGGKLVVMIHISSTLGQLLAEFNINVSNFIVNEQEQILNNKMSSFTVSRLMPHQIFNGISSFNLYGSWALKPINSTMKGIAKTSNNAWLDINKNKLKDQSDYQFAADVVITGKFGHGEVLVFADDAIFQNEYLHGNNKTMAINLAKWLSSGRFDKKNQHQEPLFTD